MLHYFGEEYHEENCGNCDNCLHPKKKVEAKNQLKELLEVVQAVKENFKADYIIDVLTRKETDEVIAHKHADLDCFGCGDEHEEKFSNAVIRQALIAGYLEKEIVITAS